MEIAVGGGSVRNLIFDDTIVVFCLQLYIARLPSDSTVAPHLQSGRVYYSTSLHDYCALATILEPFTIIVIFLRRIAWPNFLPAFSPCHQTKRLLVNPHSLSSYHIGPRLLRW